MTFANRSTLSLLCRFAFMYRIICKINPRKARQNRSRIHEGTFSLRFLSIILIVFRREASVYNVYTIQTSIKTLAQRGAGGVKSVSRVDWIARRKTLQTLSQYAQEFGLYLAFPIHLHNIIVLHFAAQLALKQKRMLQISKRSLLYLVSAGNIVHTIQHFWLIENLQLLT